MVILFKPKEVTMKTQTTIAVLASAAALAVAAVILSNNRKKSDSAEKSSKKFRNKLASLKKKAEREFNEMQQESTENPAMERVNKWVNSPS